MKIAPVIWLTGRSGAGKSTLAEEYRKLLYSLGHSVLLLDGDDIRATLSFDLGFSESDRNENVRRVSEVAILAATQGIYTIVSMISPFRACRNLVRTKCQEAGIKFIEVLVKCPEENYRTYDQEVGYEDPLTPEIVSENRQNLLA